MKPVFQLQLFAAKLPFPKDVTISELFFGNQRISRLVDFVDLFMFCGLVFDRLLNNAPTSTCTTASIV